MTNEHREQAREIMFECEQRTGMALASCSEPNDLADRIAAALSSRDAEIKQVLEGLVHAGVEFDNERIHYVVMQIHRETLAAAQVLYEKVSK